MILERIAGVRFSRVLPQWKGETVAILGGGPSLTVAQFEIVHRAHRAGKLRAIAINDAYLLAPWADVQYAADKKWHDWHTAGIEKPLLGISAESVRERWASFLGQKCSINWSADPGVDVHILKNATHPVHGYGLSTDPERLYTGRHGGFQALNIATLSGAKRVLLLGIDGRRGESGERHWHGDHPTETEAGNGKYDDMRKSFSYVENELRRLEIEVINCSMMSAIETFPKMRLEEALAA